LKSKLFYPAHLIAPKRALTARYRLTPYIYSYALQAARTGEPILRPLVYHHMDDPTAIKWSTEFYLGDGMLIAPVTAADARKWTIYLPVGDWTCLWTGQRYAGAHTIEVDAPLYEVEGLPVF